MAEESQRAKSFLREADYWFDKLRNQYKEYIAQVNETPSKYPSTAEMIADMERTGAKIAALADMRKMLRALASDEEFQEQMKGGE